ncbi:MAG: hypothetical protein NVSMB64_14340 [Candidatus Velthaea sp.]
MVTPVPALTFDPLKLVDAGSIPVIYRYDSRAQTLVEIGTDIDAEIATMVQVATHDVAVDVTLTPLYVAPSRDRFALTFGPKRGMAKEYAVVTVSLAQTQAAAALDKDMLSWAVTYTLIDGPTQDLQDTALSAAGQETLQTMHISGGTALLGLNFASGTAGGKGLGSWLSGAQTIAGDLEQSNLIQFGGASVAVANAAFATIGGILSQLGSGQRFDVEIASLGGTRIAAHSMVPNLRSAGVFRIPKDPTTFVFTPSRYQDAFGAALRQIAKDGHHVRLDPNNGAPSIVDSNGDTVASPDSDPNKGRGALSSFTLVVVHTSANV